MSTTMYLKRELGFTAKEWGRLTEQDKADLRSWAEEEMRASSPATLPEAQPA